MLHPDNERIKNVFIRDENYHIETSDEYEDDAFVSSFYKQLGLDDEKRRLDYLFMSKIDLQRKILGQHRTENKSVAGKVDMVK